VLDAENNVYLEVPYRMLSRPTITLWEHKLARKRLREQRRTAPSTRQVYSPLLTKCARLNVRAETLTRTARRNRTRRQIDSKYDSASTQAETPAPTVDIGPVRPFDDIEPW
jgi:putative transposase